MFLDCTTKSNMCKMRNGKNAQKRGNQFKEKNIIRADGDSLANSELCPQNCHGSAASAEKEVMNIDE